jgi:tricorn protease
MKQILLLALAVCTTHTIQAQTAPKWLRYSAIAPNGKTIVFTYKGDLYTVPTAGGNATPLTLHEAHDFMPVWSKDGKTIAFASDRHGNFDVFTVPATGGTVTRLTYHSASEYPYEFTPDGKHIVFGSSRGDAATNRQYPTGSMPELYQVPANGGKVTQLLTTPAEDVKFSSNGNFMLYHDKKGGENAWRKHHTSAITRDIWSYNTKQKTHTQITSFNGEDRSPVLSADEKNFYYLSEESGSFNIHKMAITGGKSVQLTQFKKHPVRFLSAATNGMLCFSYDGELYTLKEGENPQKINITIATDARTNNEQIIRVGSAGSISVAPNGKEVAFIYRGEVFVAAVEGGITKRITNTPEMETDVMFAPDGKSLIYASERKGKWRIFESKMVRKDEPYFYASTLIEEKPVIDNNNENIQPIYSPDGKELAFVENRTNLVIYNVASKQTRTILTIDYLMDWGENGHYMEWSPDSKWILFDYATKGMASTEVGLVSADGKTVKNLTQSGFNDGTAKWIMGGKAMIWFSNRDGLRAAAMSGGAQADVYGMFFSQDAWDKFRLNKEEYALLKETDEIKAKADTSKKKKENKDSVIVDWDGLELRKTKFTIHSSNLGDALVSKDGETLYYLARFERGMNLWTTNLRTRETKMLAPLNAGFSSMQWDKDQKNIFLNSGGNIIKLEPNSGKQDRISINGEMMVNLAEERAYLFSHVWRKTKKTFYTQSFHGVDWDSYKPDYEAYLPFIGNNYEFSEMLSELLGELNVSHSGSSYGNFNPDADATASLGLLYNPTHTGNGMQVLEVLKNGPLDKAGFNITPGTIIQMIDGVAIAADTDLAYYLNRKAGKNVLLTINQNGTTREIVIKPVSLGEENGLLYRRWVKRNADEVEKLSGGTLGYVHIPGMNDGAFRTTYEEMMGKYFDKKGIVVDTRNNGGGDLVADLAMFLSGKKFMDYATDQRSNGYEPNFRWTKPSISIANEANYSDGHCYAFMVKEVQIGKLVGMPVPGTCTFAGWEGLMNTGINWGVPPVGCKDVNGKYLENWQTEPDIKVANDPVSVSQGTDKQLETAVKELLKQIK